MLDRHVRRSGADYGTALASLLPTGLAWPREANSVLMRLVGGLANVLGFVDARAADLLEREVDPRFTIEMLEDWERAFGLPDECLSEPLTVADRRDALLLRITMLGAQSREFFIATALRIGYTITIQEFAPFMTGVSCVGDTRHLDDGTHYRWEIGPPEMRFYWRIRVNAVRFSWFRASSGQAGIDPHLRFAIATDLECILRRWKPAHTEIIFDYSAMSGVDYSQPYNLSFLALGLP